jgi:hypothetical protein
MALDIEPLSTTTSTSPTDSERQIMEEIARRRDELVALASDLIAFDTTAREHNDDPAREEAALQKYLAARLRTAGAETDLWEPVPEDIAGSPMTPPGLRFDGRPQLVARFPGVGGGRSLLFNGHIDVVKPDPIEQCQSQPTSRSRSLVAVLSFQRLLFPVEQVTLGVRNRIGEREEPSMRSTRPA